LFCPLNNFLAVRSHNLLVFVERRRASDSLILISDLTELPMHETDTLIQELSAPNFSPASKDKERMVPAILEFLPDAVYLFGSDGHLIKANRAGASLHPTTISTETRCCEMFWRVEGADGCVVDRALSTGERVEVEIQHEEKPFAIVVEPLTSEGLRSGAVVIARDISDLRRAEAEAIANKSFLASIADRTPDEIYALDQAGSITWMNERAQGNNLAVATGASFLSIIAAECHELANNNFEKTLRGEDTQFEIGGSRFDGSARYAEAHTSPLWKDGEIAGVLVFLRDITDRKREHELMAQSDKLRAVGELAAGVAHNLNNSLTVIQGRAQLLLRNAKDEASSKSLQIITNAVEDGTKTLRRILEFARRDSASDFAPVELNYLITSSLDIARPKWQSKSRNIEVNIHGGNPVYVMGEQAELREVVLNLIFNAVDAMPEGGVMEVGVRGEIESGCFWVADTGSGMPPDVASRIFEPFFTTKGKSGSGLGLSASHGIINRHKGEIFVVSEPGEGTRFEVRLPICEKNDRFVKSSQ